MMSLPFCRKSNFEINFISVSVFNPIVSRSRWAIWEQHGRGSIAANKQERYPISHHLQMKEKNKRENTVHPVWSFEGSRDWETTAERLYKISFPFFQGLFILMEQNPNLLLFSCYTRKKNIDWLRCLFIFFHADVCK
jgi:hypothetical protein